MPTINLPKKKQRDKTIRKQEYQDIYQSKQWKKLVAQKKKDNPLCERCESMGFTRQMDEVHHKVPWDWGVSEDDKLTLAFDPDNLESLCGPCHNVRHLELRDKK
jgi:5-methylcytosine-specific restriction endonuclease McrA